MMPSDKTQTSIDPARARLLKRMDRVDAMSVEMRECVHEFGLTIVDACRDLGITQPRQIRHLVNVIRKGSSEVGDRSNAPSLMPLGQE